MPGFRSLIKALPLAKQTYALLMDLRLRATFTKIYHTNKWGGVDSASGTGSSLAETVAIRVALPKLIQDFGITSLLDIPCGDFTWMRAVELREVRYIGADIVSEIIENNSRAFGGPGREFRCLDLTRDDLPAVDLILCRDGLVHLSHKLVRRALSRMKSSGSRYLLTTTFPDHPNNEDAFTGRWRPLNFCAPPFNCPAPLCLVSEQVPYREFCDKSLGLWVLADIPLCLPE